MKIKGKTIVNTEDTAVLLSAGPGLDSAQWRKLGTLIEHAEEMYSLLNALACDPHIVHVLDHLQEAARLVAMIDDKLDRREKKARRYPAEIKS